jgi:GSH-dependent disulfide-bond oxidoreductase
MIELFSAPTPNALKVRIALEEMELPYKVREIDFSKLEQKEPWYLKLNPNGRVPTIIDHDNGEAIFESGAILIYLAEKSGKLLPREVLPRIRVIEWLMFQMSGLGPMMGQANVFYRYAPEKIPYAIERYQREGKRLLTVLDTQLSTHEYVAGPDYSIADIAMWPWAVGHGWAGIEADDLVHLKRWLAQIRERPAVKRAAPPMPPVTADRNRLDAAVKSGQTILA